MAIDGHCGNPNPHEPHEFDRGMDPFPVVYNCSGRTWKETMEDDNLIDNVPAGMAGQTVSLGMPGMPSNTVLFRRDDCSDSTPHNAHVWTVEDDDEKEETVFCLGLDVDGNRPDQTLGDKFINIDVDMSGWNPGAPRNIYPDVTPFSSTSDPIDLSVDPAAYQRTKDYLRRHQLASDAVKPEYIQPVHNHAFIDFPVTDCPACNVEETYPPGDKGAFLVEGTGLASGDKPTQQFENLPKAFKSYTGQDMPSTEVTRWADKAMFKAEEIDATDGPRVYLLWMTPDPLGAIAAACKMYKGEVVRDLSTVTDAERLEYFAQVMKTKLKAPFEFVKFHFMIEGVTRAFTHQMVRQRTAAYAQESLRFAVKEDMPVALPPSLAGTDEAGMRAEGDNSPMTREEEMRVIWNVAKQNIDHAYSRLVDMGMPAEDARGLLPTNVLTRLHYTTDLRALLDHAGNRLCTQAQFEWRLVFAKIIEAIRNVSVDQPVFDGVVPRVNGMTSVYQSEKLLDAFKPVCFQTGKCEFKANFDRSCSIRERVDAFERNGIPSSQWEKPLETKYHGIKPGEWLLDPGAARKKA